MGNGSTSAVSETFKEQDYSINAGTTVDGSAVEFESVDALEQLSGRVNNCANIGNHFILSMKKIEFAEIRQMRMRIKFIVILLYIYCAFIMCPYSFVVETIAYQPHSKLHIYLNIQQHGY